MDTTSLGPEARSAWAIVSAAFAALGRAFICADADFRIVHASLARSEPRLVSRRAVLAPLARFERTTQRAREPGAEQNQEPTD